MNANLVLIYIVTIVMLTFIPWVLLVLQKKSSDLDGGGTLPVLCLNFFFISPFRLTF